MVTVIFRRACLAATALSALLAVSACSSFHPEGVTRFTLLNKQTYSRPLGMEGAYWHVYDDQHSHTSPCTNGAAGDHEPAQCARIDTPPIFAWDGGKCAPSDEHKQDLVTDIEPDSGRICIQGSLDAVLDCVEGNGSPRCNNTGKDASNMWGAGVGLEFSSDGKTSWDAKRRGFTGVAFDLTVLPEDSTLNLRVEIPTLLPGVTPIPSDHPLMRDDGSLIDTNGVIYSYDCTADQLSVVSDAPMRLPLLLSDALVPPSSPPSQLVPSNEHPYGSSFWLSGPSSERGWRPSPVRPGHNEFKWPDVMPPLPIPEDDENYTFDPTQTLGIHFHVVHPEHDNDTTSTGFHFCIDNLALLEE